MSPPVLFTEWWQFWESRGLSLHLVFDCDREMRFLVIWQLLSWLSFGFDISSRFPATHTLCFWHLWGAVRSWLWQVAVWSPFLLAEFCDVFWVSCEFIEHHMEDNDVFICWPLSSFASPGFEMTLKITNLLPVVWSEVTYRLSAALHPPMPPTLPLHDYL